MSEKKTGNDTAADQAKGPMKDPKIDVSVKPKDDAPTKDERRANHQYADKVRKRLAEDVKKSVDQAGGDAERRNSPTPRKDQLDAAKRTADDAAKQIDPRKIERIRVKVDGAEVADRQPGEASPPPPAKK